MKPQSPPIIVVSSKYSVGTTDSIDMFPLAARFVIVFQPVKSGISDWISMVMTVDPLVGATTASAALVLAHSSTDTCEAELGERASALGATGDSVRAITPASRTRERGMFFIRSNVLCCSLQDTRCR